MNVNLTGHHVEITDALESAVNSALDKVLRHYPDIVSARVILTVEKHEQIAEAVVHFLGQDIAAKGTSEDLYHSINDMRSKLETLLQRRKSTIKSHSHEKPSPEETD
jgi:putative sigma-54 modulation protein